MIIYFWGRYKMQNSGSALCCWIQPFIKHKYRFESHAEWIDSVRIFISLIETPLLMLACISDFGSTQTRSFVCCSQMYLRELLRLMLPRFHQHLKRLGEDGLQLLFCHRWVLLCFKREFPDTEALRMWEACWAHYQVPRPKPCTLMYKSFFYQVVGMRIGICVHARNLVSGWWFLSSTANKFTTCTKTM